MNYFGQTAASTTTATGTIGAGQVVDVTIGTVTGAMQYNIYGIDSSTSYLLATCGGVQVHPAGVRDPPHVRRPSRPPTRAPASRPGWKASSRSCPGVSPAAGVYPTGWIGGYYNGAVGPHLNYNTSTRP